MPFNFDVMRKVFNEVLGMHIEIPDNPRIVSLAPSITDILHEIGVWDNVVGVSIYCNIPEKAREKPRVGAYLKVMYNRLDELEPDIIFTTTGAQRNVTFELRDKGYNVYPVKLPISLYGIIENVFEIAGVLDKVDEAISLSKEYIDILDGIKDSLSGSVYYEIDLGGPITAGKLSYIHNSLEHIGLRNIYGDQYVTWVQPDFNYVVEKNPDIILYEMKPGSNITVDQLKKIFEERGWGDIEAFKNDRIFLLKPDSLAHYGPTHFKILEDLVTRIEGTLLS